MRAPPGDSPTLRTAAEREALGAATHFAGVRGLGTPPEGPYLDALPQARRSIRDRLVRGLLRGTPAGLPDPETAIAGAAVDRLPFDPPTDVPTGDRDRIALLSLPASGRALSVPVAGDDGFDRVRIGDPVALVGPDAVERVTHPIDLVDPLEREGAFVDGEQVAVVETELAESVANLALALLAERVQADRAPGPVLDASGEAVPAADRPAYLERLVTRGHPFHPAAKIRRGMSPADGLAYAPEFASTVRLRAVAIREDVARRTAAGDRTLTDRLFAAFDGLESAAAAAVPSDLSEYAVVPVHPWQYHRVLPQRYARQLSDGRIVPVEDYSLAATPLLNLRTVVPETGGGDPAPHCKLPIAVRTTNVERTLSPQAVNNGPRTTRLWRAVDRRASLGALGLLEERAAASYYPPGGPHTGGEAYDDARHLGALLRQNPRSHPLAAGEARPIPAASLAARSPRTGRPLVASVVDRFPGADDARDAAEAFLAAYAEAVVPPQLRLLSAYGVALESHLQNCYVVFEAWRPVGVLVRDLGGIRVHDGRLARHGLSFEAYPDSDLNADGIDDLHRKLYYALFQNHLAELVAALARSTPVDAATCWEHVRAVCEETFDRLRADGVPESTLGTDEAALFEDPIPFKALTAMRLGGKRHEYVTSRVSNPLAGTATSGDQG